MKSNDKKINVKKHFNKNKIALFCSIGATCAFSFSAGFYSSKALSISKINENITSQSHTNNINTLYSHDSHIIKKYKRNVADTYQGTLSFPATLTRWDNGKKVTISSATFHDASYYPSPKNPYKINQMSDDDWKKMNTLWDETKAFTNSSFVEWAINNHQLKKYPGMKYQYYQSYKENGKLTGDTHELPDDALAVTKEFNMDLTQPGYMITGLYLAPGETLKLSFPGLTDKEVSDLNLSLSLGDNEQPQPSYNNVTYKRCTTRLPIMKSYVDVKKNDLVYGTPFGGIVNLVVNKEPDFNSIKNVKMVIDGAVEALHYIHGYTTESEWKRLTQEAKAPIFDVGGDHIKFSGPVFSIGGFFSNKNLPYNEKSYPYKYMDIMDKMALDALYSTGQNAKWKASYRQCYSSFVYAGLAVSFVGASYIDAPWNWSSYIMQYDNVVNNGVWGILHENNHQNQQGGLWAYKGYGEVSNNVLTLASYLNFTNVSNNRYGWIKYNSENGEISNKGTGAHLVKLNGWFNVNQYLNNKSATVSPDQERDGTDYDYSIIMSVFGTKIFQKIVRSFSDSSITDYAGNKIVVPDQISKDNNARLVYRTSLMTGYNWTEYTYNSGLISSSMRDVINNNLPKNLPKFLPIGSFYGSAIKYGDNSSSFVPIQRPFTIPKTSFEKGYKFNLSQTTKTASKKQMESTYTLTDYKITKEPTNGKSEFDSSTNTLTYIPNIEDLNKEDSFEYQVTIQDGMGNSKVVTYKVDLQLEGNTKVFEVPSNENYEQYYPTQVNSCHNNIDWNQEVVLDNNSYKARTLSYLEDNEKGTPIGFGFETRTIENPVTKEYGIEMDIPLNQTLEVNYLDLWPKNTAVGNGGYCPDDIVIKDDKDNVLYDGEFIKSTTARFSFKNVKTSKLKVYLKTSNIENGVKTPAKREIRLSYLDVGSQVQPNKIIQSNSNYIYIVGKWKKGLNNKINDSSLYTKSPKSKLLFNFKGTAFSIVGAKDKDYGSFDVYVDKKYYGSVDTNSTQSLSSQNLMNVTNLKDGNHTVSIVTKNSSPVEIQYIGLEGNANKFNANDSYDLFVIGIPIILGICILVTILLVLHFKLRSNITNLVNKSKNKK